MSVIPFSSKAIDQSFRRAGVYEQGHFVLNSGRHSDVKIFLDRIVNHPEALSKLHDGLEECLDFLHNTGKTALITVPEGMTKIVKARKRLGFLALHPMKLGPRRFEVPEPDRSIIMGLEEAVIGDDVLTTGGTPAALAREIIKINPDIKLHLVSGVLRGEIAPQYGKLFVSQTHMVVKRLPDWSPEECPYHPQGSVS